MSVIERLNRLVPDLAHTVLRFPVSCAVAVLACVIVNLDAARVFTLGPVFEWRVYFSLAAAFLGSGAGHLFAEGRGLPRGHGSSIAILLAAVFGLGYFFFQVTDADPMFLFPSALLLTMTAGFIGRPGDERALWLFNARFGLAAVLAFVVALVFCGGLSAILASLEYLFEVSMKGQYFEHIWVTGASLIGPVYGLSLMPRDINEPLVFEDPPNLLDRGISVLINFVLAPMILVYLLILHLYAGKIALDWSLPKGQIGIMVLVFGLGGTGTFLIARPWAERGTRVLRWFLDSWFWLTIVPVALLAIGVARRLSDYGVTPERYGLVMVGAWLAGMVVYFSLRRRRVSSSVIMLSLSAMLFVGAFGPWGARGLSISSQLGRLDSLLAAHGLIDNGRLKAALPDPSVLPAAASNDGASIVDFLRKAEAIDRLKPYFAGRDDDPFLDDRRGSWDIAHAINEQFGFRDGSFSPSGGRHVYFNGSQPQIADFSGDFALYGPIHVNHYAASGQKPADSRTAVVAFMDRRLLKIEYAGQAWDIDGATLLREAEQHSRGKGARYKVFRKVIDGPGGRATLFITSAQGELGGTRDKLRTLVFWAVLPRR